MGRECGRAALRKVHVSLPKGGIGKGAMEVVVFVLLWLMNDSEMKSSLQHTLIVTLELGDDNLLRY